MEAEIIIFQSTMGNIRSILSLLLTRKGLFLFWLAVLKTPPPFFPSPSHSFSSEHYQKISLTLDAFYGEFIVGTMFMKCRNNRMSEPWGARKEQWDIGKCGVGTGVPE